MNTYKDSSISDTLKDYISKHVPKKATNILFQLFNGIQAMFQNLEYRLNIFKRESNILTAQYMSSLRNLASMNGFEPSLKQSARGLLLIRISPKLFNRVGYPLFIRPNSIFTNKLTKLNYIYTLDKIIKITEHETFVPVIEGVAREEYFTGYDRHINRFYIRTENIADGSLTLEANGIRFLNVKSFYDSNDINDNKQFVIKFSNDAQRPIILYVKGLNPDEQLVVNYIETSGTLGNLAKRAQFETESLLDSIGSLVTYADDEVEIISTNGFKLGSDGTDENSLRAAIGYNHGMNVLFDNVSYRNFLSRYNTIAIQTININRLSKQVNHIYLWKKPFLNPDDIVNDYRRVIHNKLYLLNEEDTKAIDEVLTEHEYCLSSHELHQPKIRKYAMQFSFRKENELKEHKSTLEKMIYEEFGKFLIDRFHSINFESMFSDYQMKNDVVFDWLILTEDMVSNSNKITSIKHYRGLDSNNKLYEEFENSEDAYLPILQAEFNVKVADGHYSYGGGSSYQDIQITNDINWTIQFES